MKRVHSIAGSGGGAPKDTARAPFSFESVEGFSCILAPQLFFVAGEGPDR
jgi:hypothetical protein